MISSTETSKACLDCTIPTANSIKKPLNPDPNNSFLDLNLVMSELNVDAGSMVICCKSEQGSEMNSLINIFNRLKIDQFVKKFVEIGIIKILPIFCLFVLLAYIVKTFVPESWIINLFGGNHFYSVPMAAIISLPLYVSDATVVPLLQVLRDAGASNGAMLAFMIAGPGTSLGVIAGLNLVMRRRAIFLYTVMILFGAILMGYLYDLLLLFI
jgi:uncharacterized membrane protein YraQ (UPF0718 family)